MIINFFDRDLLVQINDDKTIIAYDTNFKILDDSELLKLIQKESIYVNTDSGFFHIHLTKVDEAPNEKSCSVSGGHNFMKTGLRTDIMDEPESAFFPKGRFRILNSIYKCKNAECGFRFYLLTRYRI